MTPITREQTEPAPPQATSSARRRTLIWQGRAALPLGMAAVIALAVASLLIGSGNISTRATVDILIRWAAGELPVGSRETAEILVLERRLPRTLLAIVVGGALGVAGVVMHAMTRNPLADPGLLGVNAGAHTAIVIGAALAGTATLGTGHVWLAIAGALLTTVVVYLVGTSGRMGGSPVNLVLTGVAVGAVLSGLSLAISLAMPEVFDRIRHWSAGSLQSRGWDELSTVLPFLLTGLLLALALSRVLNALGLGDDAAVALGAKPGLIRIVGLFTVTLLCAAATAAAGPLSFIGLIVPHVMRLLLGPDHRWLIPMSLIGAACLMLAADVLARVLVAAELPAGVVTAFLGAPVLIALTRRKQVRQL